ncbi:hypothetical protein E4T47_01449 [Aureobasidium subglaciale]|nr:hypothetical protein E4T43_03098 [Aureobasidium subglaciale]KAI5275480.1 hypothetical protein E4T47_01449 [Aureobasidium subglaciale]
MRCCILRQVCSNFDIRIGYASSRISPQIFGGAVGMMSVIKEGRSDQKRPFFFFSFALHQAHLPHTAGQSATVLSSLGPGGHTSMLITTQHSCLASLGSIV